MNNHNGKAVKVEVSPAMLEQLQEGLRGLAQQREQIDAAYKRQEGAVELMGLLLKAQEEDAPKGHPEYGTASHVLADAARYDG